MKKFKLTTFIKKAAVFGIDARITFAVTAIAAFIVGINQFASIESNNKDSANLDLRQIKNSVLKYYTEEYTIPADVDTLITTNYLDLAQQFNVDPWGNAYSISYVTKDETIGYSTMSTKYIMLVALGKNGVKDTTNATDYASWLTKQSSGDDIILKFDTKQIEKQIALAENNQLIIIKNLLDNYVASKKQELADYCAILGNQTALNCDINQDGTYDKNEEFQLNFMLKNIDDSNGNYYNPDNAEYKSGYINSANASNNMYAFMTKIGANPDLAISPRGLTLHFTSNKYNNNSFPYYAQVWYDNEVTVF